MSSSYKNEQIISNFDPYQTGFELASVSKIFTSLWAVHASKKSYVLLPRQFKSEFSYNPENGELFIKGNLDPMFGIDRLIDALQTIKFQLHKAGYTGFSTVRKIYLHNHLLI